MTLKIRNRLNLISSTFALLFLIFNLVIFIYQYVNGNFFIPSPTSIPEGRNFFTNYNPLNVIISLFLEMIYACGVFFILYTVFEKTQSSEVIFFSVFTFAILLDSLRLWIVIFNLAYTYSVKLIFIQNVIVFSRLLVPFSLFLLVLLSEPEKRQFIEQNIFIAVITAMVFGFFDPINTGKFAPNLLHYYAYQRTFHIASIIFILGSIIWMYFDNKRKLISNKITIGFSMLALGFFFITDSSTFLFLLIGQILLYFGTYIYLRQLHNQYLWNY